MLEPSLYRRRHTVPDVSCRVRLSCLGNSEKLCSRNAIFKLVVTNLLNAHCYNDVVFESHCKKSVSDCNQKYSTDGTKSKPLHVFSLNFIRYWPIFKVLSLAHSTLYICRNDISTPQTRHCTTLWNINVSFWILIFTKKCDVIFNWSFCWKFAAECASERILKSGQYLLKLYVVMKFDGLLFTGRQHCLLCRALY